MAVVAEAPKGVSLLTIAFSLGRAWSNREGTCKAGRKFSLRVRLNESTEKAYQYIY